MVEHKHILGSAARIAGEQSKRLAPFWAGLRFSRLGTLCRALPMYASGPLRTMALKENCALLSSGMAQRNPYRWIEVESFIPDDTWGRHGLVHIRPVAGQGLSTDLFVECSKKLSRNYAVGTRFRIRAKLTDKEGGGEFLYSHFGWDYEVVS